MKSYESVTLEKRGERGTIANEFRELLRTNRMLLRRTQFDLFHLARTDRLTRRADLAIVGLNVVGLDAAKFRELARDDLADVLAVIEIFDATTLFAADESSFDLVHLDVHAIEETIHALHRRMFFREALDFDAFVIDDRRTIEFFDRGLFRIPT